jgi:hypothetical protein
MPPQALFGLSVLFSFIAWGLVAARVIWPALRNREPVEALPPLLLLHCFRFVGLSFLVPGVVSPELPAEFARPAAYGDLLTAVLALVALMTLRGPLGLPLVWAFNVVGATDLLHAFYQGNRTDLGLEPGLQGAAFYITTVLVPLLLTTHALIFRILIKREAR